MLILFIQAFFENLPQFKSKSPVSGKMAILKAPPITGSSDLSPPRTAENESEATTTATEDNREGDTKAKIEKGQGEPGTIHPPETEEKSDIQPKDENSSGEIDFDKELADDGRGDTGIDSSDEPKADMIGQENESFSNKFKAENEIKILSRQTCGKVQDEKDRSCIDLTESPIKHRDPDPDVDGEDAVAKKQEVTAVATASSPMERSIHVVDEVDDSDEFIVVDYSVESDTTAPDTAVDREKRVAVSEQEQQQEVERVQREESPSPETKHDETGAREESSVSQGQPTVRERTKEVDSLSNSANSGADGVDVKSEKDTESFETCRTDEGHVELHESASNIGAEEKQEAEIAGEAKSQSSSTERTKLIQSAEHEDTVTGSCDSKVFWNESQAGNVEESKESQLTTGALVSSIAEDVAEIEAPRIPSTDSVTGLGLSKDAVELFDDSVENRSDSDRADSDAGEESVEEGQSEFLENKAPMTQIEEDLGVSRPNAQRGEKRRLHSNGFEDDTENWNDGTKLKTVRKSDDSESWDDVFKGNTEADKDTSVERESSREYFVCLVLSQKLVVATVMSGSFPLFLWVFCFPTVAGRLLQSP